MENNNIQDIWNDVLELAEDDEFWEEQEKAEQEFIKSQEEAYEEHN